MIYYVDRSLGKKYSSYSNESMEQIYKDTDFKTPLIFILSQGAHPLHHLMKLAKELQIGQDKIFTISLG